MHPGRVLLIFALVVFAGGALLAPWLYWVVQWAAEHFPALHSLSRNPFHRFVNRALLGLALLGIWPLARAIGLRSWRALGWISWRGQGRRLGWGVLLGFISLAVVAGVTLGLDVRAVKTDLTASRLASRLATAALAAVAVSVLEETFFRGAVMGALRRVGSWRFALLWSGAIYAIVHFFQRPASPETVCWYSGFGILAGMLRGFVDWQALVPGFFTLLLAGLILGLAYQRTGNLYFSIGLHAGWIFWLKFFGAVTVLRKGASPWLWGTDRLFDGWLATAALAVVFLLLWRWLTPGEDSANHGGKEPPNPDLG